MLAFSILSHVSNEIFLTNPREMLNVSDAVQIAQSGGQKRDDPII